MLVGNSPMLTRLPAFSMSRAVLFLILGRRAPPIISITHTGHRDGAASRQRLSSLSLSARALSSELAISSANVDLAAVAVHARGADAHG